MNVSPVGYANQNMSTRRGFNNFQKRLIHQIVQDEYPDLVSIGSSGFVQVIPRDEERERAKQESRNRAFEEKLTHQIGLRWLAEAMTAQDTTPVDAWKRVLGPAENDEQAKEYEELIERLKAKRTVLVGHNMILDLMFFHTCFFGPLPDRVEAFQTTMSQLFSLIVDTKYMATHETQFAKLDSSSLQELDRQLSDRTFPAIGRSLTLALSATYLTRAQRPIPTISTTTPRPITKQASTASSPPKSSSDSRPSSRPTATTWTRTASPTTSSATTKPTNPHPKTAASLSHLLLPAPRLTLRRIYARGIGWIRSVPCRWTMTRPLATSRRRWCRRGRKRADNLLLRKRRSGSRS